MKKPTISWLVGAVLAIALPAQVFAQASPGAQSDAFTFSARANGGFDNPVAAASLEDYRGGTDTVNNDARLAGTTAGNAATNVATGTNNINAGSFANMTGLPVVIQNSGANVLIQNSTILNLQLN